MGIRFRPDSDLKLPQQLRRLKMMTLMILKYLMIAISHMAVVWKVYIYRIQSVKIWRNHFKKSGNKVEDLA
jgi:hypothetical protein